MECADSSNASAIIHGQRVTLWKSAQSANASWYSRPMVRHMKSTHNEEEGAPKQERIKEGGRYGQMEGGKQ